MRPLSAVLRDGREIVTRQAAPDDYATVLRLHQRCSVQTLHSRYCRALRIVPRSTWRAWTTSSGSLAMLTSPRDLSGDVVAMTTLLPDPASAGSAELAVLVEDAYQHQGLCRALLPDVVGQARRRGFRRLTAYGLASSTGWWSTVRRLPGAELTPVDCGTRSVSVDLASVDEGGLAA
jgi:GNAT superfamily N-acetyltransferase